jgi:ABC-2 type transport system ATP-binding protein
MDEAEALADIVGIIDNGILVAEGTPQEFIKQMGADVFQIEGSGNQEAFIERLGQLPFVQAINTSNGTMQISAGKGSSRLVEIVKASQDSAFRIEDVSIAKPTLGDVFLKHTGRQLRDK